MALVLPAFRSSLAAATAAAVAAVAAFANFAAAVSGARLAPKTKTSATCLGPTAVWITDKI